MARYCFLLRVRPERMDEYRRRHAAVWPEMLRALADTGWRNYSLFLHDDGLLVGYVEAHDLRGRTGRPRRQRPLEGRDGPVLPRPGGRRPGRGAGPAGGGLPPRGPAPPGARDHLTKALRFPSQPANGPFVPDPLTCAESPIYGPVAQFAHSPSEVPRCRAVLNAIVSMRSCASSRRTAA